MWIEILLGAIIVIVLWMACRKPPGLPPGRWGLPLFGYIDRSGKYIDDVFKDFQKKYGDVYVWRFGTTPQIIVHDFHILKQIYGNQDFIDRPDMESFKLDQEVGLGVSASNGTIWHVNRRFCLRQLRELGMGKSRLVLAVQEQAQILLEAIQKDEGKAAPITPALNFVVTNVIWKLVANKHLDIDSPKHERLQKMVEEANVAVSKMAISDLMPWTKKVIPSFLRRKLFQVDTMMKIIDEFSEYFYEMIREHKAKLNPDDPKDFIDAYLLDMKEAKETQGDAETVRSEEDLRMTLFDLFFAGTDTTVNHMKWIILYMAAHPGTQCKLQQEIDEVIPKGTFATLEDKTRLPYTEAVINEVMRMASFVNSGLPHVASRDTTLAGYKIPKGTLVTSCTASIHLDPRYWDNPDQFRPERWLSPEGKFVMKKEGFLPFGTGKRSCIGENLARMDILIFATAVFQNFTISPPEGGEVDLMYNDKIFVFHCPKKQDLVFTSRN